MDASGETVNVDDLNANDASRALSGESIENHTREVENGQAVVESHSNKSKYTDSFLMQPAWSYRKATARGKGKGKAKEWMVHRASKCYDVFLLFFSLCTPFSCPQNFLLDLSKSIHISLSQTICLFSQARCSVDEGDI